MPVTTTRLPVQGWGSEARTASISSRTMAVWRDFSRKSRALKTAWRSTAEMTWGYWAARAENSRMAARFSL